jgi:hypothetical protein
MSAYSGSSPSAILYGSGLFITFLTVTLSADSAVAFEDRFGDSLYNRVQYTDGRHDRGSMESGASAMSGPGGRNGTNSHSDDGGGFPGPGGRNGGPDDHRGPGPGGDEGQSRRGRGPGR